MAENFKIPSVSWTFIIVCLFLRTKAYELPTYDHGVNIHTNRPLVLGHRGFSGAYPDHSSISYEEAIKQGTDIIECDVSLTKDLVPICLHEPWIKDSTDVADHPEFANRSKTLNISGRVISDDWFTTDFSLEEIKTLRIRQMMASRDPTFNGKFPITTLEEYINIAANSTRTIGLYTETKHPKWFNSLQVVKDAGRRFEDIVLELLMKYGFHSKMDPCFLQSFDEESLLYMANKTDLPLIMLLSGSRTGDSITDENLAEWGNFCYGIGPNKESIVVTNNGKINDVTDLISRAHTHGLKVHPWTFRNEDTYIAWDYLKDPWNEYDKFLSLGVDGYFTDFPPTCFRFLEEKYKVCNEPTNSVRDVFNTNVCIILWSIETLIILFFQ